MRRDEGSDVSELEPGAERELEALDRALAGEPVEPDLEPFARLARELRAERPEPRPELAAELDARAAAGFGSSRGVLRGAASRLRGRLAGLRPAQLLAPAGALATLALVVSVAVIQSGGGSDGPRSLDAPTAAPPEAPQADGEGAADAEDAPSSATPRAATDGEPAGPGGAATALPESLPPIPPANRLAPGEEERRVERLASLELSADSEEFAEVADGVIEVADRYRGIVVSSRQTASDESSRATFELAIPSERLTAALADLSELASVESRSEGSLDVTGPTVSARERRDDAKAEVEALRRQLADADSPTQTRRIRDRLDEAREKLAVARSQVRRLDRRARFANVSVTLTADANGDGEWGIGEALDDAGRLLSTAAGVILVAGAALLPLAILVVAFWLVRGATIRRGRNRALDGGDRGQTEA